MDINSVVLNSFTKCTNKAIDLHTLISTLELDSLDTISILVDIEKDLDVKLSEEIVADISTLSIQQLSDSIVAQVSSN
ncbi:acyl carrier protein [bacterium]|nr:acyl carrier protein [bacterium]